MKTISRTRKCVGYLALAIVLLIAADRYYPAAMCALGIDASGQKAGLIRAPNGGARVVGLCEINGIMYAMRPLRNFKTNQCCYLTPLAKSGYIAVAGGEKNRYLPGKQYRILRKGKAVICA